MPISDFRQILKRLVGQVPGAWGAIFVDWEGESVDLYAVSDEYEVKLAGAHAGLLLSRVVSSGKDSGMGRTLTAVIRCKENTFLLHTLDEEYFVLLGVKPSANVGIARWFLALAVTDLRKHV